MNNYIYQPVTNTWLIYDAIAKAKKNKEKVLWLQGSQGASKTVSVLMMIIDAFKQNNNLEITVCSAEKTKLKDTAWNDIVKIIKDWNLYDNFRVLDHISKIKPIDPKKSGFIEFIGLDQEDIGKGRRRDIIFANEVNKLSFKKFDNISERAKFIIADFNPDAKFFAHDDLTANNFLKVTFEGNEKLSIQEKETILSYKQKGFNPDGTIKNQYYANKWRVLGCGEIGKVEGVVFNDWTKISLLTYTQIKAKENSSIDFGASDPMAVLNWKYEVLDDGTQNLYLREVFYKSENDVLAELDSSVNYKKDDGSILLYIANLINHPKQMFTICDNGGARNNYSSNNFKIAKLLDNGYNVTPALKAPNSIHLGIEILKSINVYYIGENIDFEVNNYTNDSDREGFIDGKYIDKNNHTIDCARNIALFLYKAGLIKYN
jgi:hypothetical protein